MVFYGFAVFLATKCLLRCTTFGTDSCHVKNGLTGDCSCPTGYTASQRMRAFVFCSYNSRWHGSLLYACHKTAAERSLTALYQGGYQDLWAQAGCSIGNKYASSTCTCPAGSTAKHFANVHKESARLVSNYCIKDAILAGSQQECILAYCNTFNDLKSAFCGGGTCLTQAHKQSCYDHWIRTGKEEGRSIILLVLFFSVVVAPCF